MTRIEDRTRPLKGPGSQIPKLLEQGLGGSAALLLALLIAVTVIDVVGRYFFNAPLTGAFELTQLILGALVFSALPLTTWRAEHVQVDLLGALQTGKLGQVLTIVGGLFTAAVLLTFSWRLATHAMMVGHDGLATTALHIPLAPFGFLAALSCVISAMAAVLRVLRPMLQGKSGHAREVS